MGAGVIPFAVEDGRVFFLFQLTFSGRKAGYLVDFGGGLGVNETFRETAIREFVEETETMYFSEDIQQACRTPESVENQLPIVAALFDKTLSRHADSWCRRAPGDSLRPKQWKTFFIEFPYREIERMNHAWKTDKVGRFKKQRQLIWVEGHELLDIYRCMPDKLWKRVRQLENARVKIRSILRRHQS